MIFDNTMKFICRLLSVIIIPALLVACDEEAGFSVNPSLRLSFSRDTITFDTIFTTVGSPTAGLLVHNYNRESLRIRNVMLGSGGQSGFNVLVDGQYGTNINDIEVRAKDSIFVYASVRLESNGADVPLQVKDSLLFTLESGVQQKVMLLAYGRDVTFLRAENVAADRTIGKGHYVIYDSLTVAPGATLTLAEGATLYFHDRAFLKVEGRLVAAGSKERPIIMRGDRTDNMFSYLPYDRVPGQWGGVVFTSTSNENVLSHCDIHSARYGVRVEQGDTAAQRITIESSKLYNFDGNALELNMAHATVSNSLIANAQGNCVKVVGGDVSFVHCTIANFYVWKERDVALALYNNADGEPAPLRRALFANCMITGSRSDEVMGYLTDLGDTIPGGSNYCFENSFVNTVAEGDTCFVDVTFDVQESSSFAAGNFKLIDHETFNYDFHLTGESLARGRASDSYLEALPYDLDGVPREAGAVDAGCYQFVKPAEE